MIAGLFWNNYALLCQTGRLDAIKMAGDEQGWCVFIELTYKTDLKLAERLLDLYHLAESLGE